MQNENDDGHTNRDIIDGIRRCAVAWDLLHVIDEIDPPACCHTESAYDDIWAMVQELCSQHQPPLNRFDAFGNRVVDTTDPGTCPECGSHDHVNHPL